MLHPGLRLGERYRLDNRIGAGGMGEVWQAFDEVLGRVVAVKAMLPAVADEPDFARRFQIEAQAMASVNHPAVASIHDYGRSNGVTFLVMEFIDGESLAQVLRRSGRLSPAETMRLIAQAADGLQAVHDRGIVHRDIKPANLLIRRNGSLLITDFGISRAYDSTHLTTSGAILGTPTYLSPEQVLGQPATALSDVYSLGLTAYECLAGRRPFGGDNPYAVALQRLQVAPAALTGFVSGPVLAVIEYALAVDPANRWPSATAMADAARAAAVSPAWPSGQRPADVGGSAPVAPVAGPSATPSGSVPPVSSPSGPVPPVSSPSGSVPPVSSPSGLVPPVSGSASPAWGSVSPGPGLAGPVPGSASPAQGSVSPAWGSIPSGPGLAAPVSGSPFSGPPGSAPSISAPPGSVPPAPPAPKSSLRRRSLIAAVLVVILLGGGFAAWKIRDPGDTGGARGQATAGPSTDPSASVLQQANLAACDKWLCPTKPLCWGGLVAMAGIAVPPRPVDCAKAHYWETFVAIYRPADAADTRQDELMQRADVKAACSAAVMASRSSKPSVTEGWARDAWPVQLSGNGAWFLHCIAFSKGGERSGSAFRTS